ncbi:hypothetical protein GQ600_21698 [Phytophthora cactorum]|nr:hypothetical protein GQ600_21698 [Phytophthora cactorum]
MPPPPEARGPQSHASTPHRMDIDFSTPMRLPRARFAIRRERPCRVVSDGGRPSPQDATVAA